MKRSTLALLAPPIAACRFGCLSCCAAPITVFWITGIVSLAYGLAGGPSQGQGVSWPTLGLGILLWGISAIWARTSIQTAADGHCAPADEALRDRSNA